MTETQFLAMAKKAAELCKQYNIQVGPKTVLWHAEVSKNLGIAQRGKWDATELSFEPNVKGAAACGEYLRRAVRLQMSPPVKPVTAAPSKPVQAPQPVPQPVTAPPAKRGFWARLFGWFKGA
jgi:hypothetical protein